MWFTVPCGLSGEDVSIVGSLCAAGSVRVENLGGISLTDAGVQVLQKQGLARLLDEVRIRYVTSLGWCLPVGVATSVDDTMST